MRKEDVKKGSIYELDGVVPLKEALPLGIQHVLAMFLGNISPLLIIAGMLGLSPDLKSALIQNAMFIAGAVTLVQLYPVWKIGAKLPIVMGTSSGFIGTAKAMGALYGYGALMGASLIGGLFEMVLGFFIKPLRKLFPPVVTSLVIISIGLSLLPVGINYFGGGSGAADFGDPKHLLVGTFVILVIIIAKQIKGFVNNASILIGIIAGYILAIVLGMVDFTQVQTASWIALPTFMPVKMEFNLEAIIAMGIMFIATTVETVGDVSGITNGGLDREATSEELQGGVLADGLGSVVASLFGVLPNTSFSQNVGLVSVTKVVNRFTIMTGAIFLILVAMTKVVNRIALASGAVFLILCGLIPKLGALISIMPQSVLGGAAVIMFASILVSGIQSLMRVEFNERNTLIIALAIGLGIGIGQVPTVLAQLPSWVGNIFAQNGIIMTFVIATVLNLILPGKKD